MGSEASLYFDNIQVDWEKNAAPSACRILFRRLDFLQVPLRKLPPDLRAFYKRGRYFRPETQIYSVLVGSAAAGERRLSILGYSQFLIMSFYLITTAVLSTIYIIVTEL